MGPVIIPVLRKLKMGQTEREEGVKVASEESRDANHGRRDHPAQYTDYFPVLYQKIIRKIIPVLFVTLGFGLIGFLDDYLKVVMKRSDGLFPKQKMALQIIVTAIFAYYLVKVCRHCP